MSTRGARSKRQRASELQIEDLLVAACMMWRMDSSSPRTLGSEDRDFREFFGCNVLNALIFWNLLGNLDLRPADGTHHHLLWAFCYLKQYPKTRAMSVLCGGADPSTCRKWVWLFIRATASLEPYVIIWENRLNNDKGNDCLISVDGVDCRAPNLGPAFSSHKFAKKGGVQYKVGLCILTGDIVWINGPFPCGTWNDLAIFCSSLINHLKPTERVEADDGYVGEHPRYVKCPAGFANPRATEFMQARVRSRQETINKRFKHFEILKVIFRNDLSYHRDAMRAIAVISQVAISQGEKLFECGYRDPPYGDDDDDDGSL